MAIAAETAALPDFVCNAGAVIGYGLPRQAPAQQILSEVSSRISELTRLALGHHAGPPAGAVERAAAFLRGWRGEAPGPPLAREISGRAGLLGGTISVRSRVASEDRSHRLR